MQSTKWVHEPLSISKVKANHWPFYEVFQIFANFLLDLWSKDHDQASEAYQVHVHIVYKNEYYLCKSLCYITGISFMIKTTEVIDTFSTEYQRSGPHGLIVSLKTEIDPLSEGLHVHDKNEVIAVVIPVKMAEKSNSASISI